MLCLFLAWLRYGIAIPVDEPADVGVAIPALEIVELGVGIVVVPTVPQGVDFRDFTVRLQRLAVGVIAVAGFGCFSAVNEPHYISLQIGDVVVGHWAGGAVGVGQGIRGSLGIVGKVQNLRRNSSVCSCCGNRFPQKPSACVDIAMRLCDGEFQITASLRYIALSPQRDFSPCGASAS